MAGLVQTIAASAGDTSYEILIGSSILPDAFRRPEITSPERIALIVSASIQDLYGQYIRESLGALRDRVSFMVMDDGEEKKSYLHAERFLECFIAEKINRKSAVIGIGGGVTGDFAGFCAGVYMRGIPVIHVPTTLLAMVDSSIGGKVAVNLTVGKNIVGLFHQPSLVVSDIQFIRSLPDAELKNGLTEALKHGLIGDSGTLDVLEDNDLASIRREEALSKLVALSAAFKSGIVGKDERESGLRAVLNFGHTVGHALESAMEYRGIAHGQAVAAGIRVKLEVCRRMGLLADDEAKRANAVIDRYGMAPAGLGIDIDRVMRHMAYDKKNFGDSINFVMLEGLGNPRINQSIPAALLKEVMVKLC